MLAKLVGRLALGHHGLDARATTILSDMTPASSGDQGPDMPRPLLDCGPYANQVRSARHPGRAGGLWTGGRAAVAAEPCRVRARARAPLGMRMCTCGRLRSFASPVPRSRANLPLAVPLDAVQLDAGRRVLLKRRLPATIATST